MISLEEFALLLDKRLMEEREFTRKFYRNTVMIVIESLQKDMTNLRLEVKSFMDESTLLSLDEMDTYMKREVAALKSKVSKVLQLVK